MKSKNIYIPSSLAFLFILTVVGFMTSCTKTEYEESKRPFTEVLSFRLHTDIPGLDSLDAVIAGDSISIYWDYQQEMPTTISPNITLSPGGTISPASGESVEFSSNTVYTVTAEDGTKKEYRLIPILNVAIPVITSFNTGYSKVAWGNAYISDGLTYRYNGKNYFDILKKGRQRDSILTLMDIRTGIQHEMPLSFFAPNHSIIVQGEYFITGQGTANDFRIYLKRVSDGFEVEAPIDDITENRITAIMPDYSAEQDTGAHQLMMRMNGRYYEGETINIGKPAPGYLKASVSIGNLDQALPRNQEIVLNVSDITDDYQGAVSRYYGLTEIKRVEFVFFKEDFKGTSGISFYREDSEEATNGAGTFKIDDSKLKLKLATYLDEKSVWSNFNSIKFVYNYEDWRTKSYREAEKIFLMPEGSSLKLTD